MLRRAFIFFAKKVMAAGRSEEYPNNNHCIEKGLKYCIKYQYFKPFV
jgi:hypothetical protein